MPNTFEIVPAKRSVFLKFLSKKGFNQISCKGDHFKFNSKPKLTRPLILVLIDPIPIPYIRDTLESIGCPESDYFAFVFKKSKEMKSKVKKDKKVK